MQHFLKFLLIGVLAYLSTYILPFWGVALAGFIVSVSIRSSNLSSFIIAFLAVFILWGAMAYYIDTETGGNLTGRVSELLGIDPPIITLITATLGGITAALGSLTGSLLRGGEVEERKTGYY
jgi:hypothetical protein